VSKGRVLIIEADEWLAAVLGKFLSDAGYAVDFATGAKEGFDKVRRLSPDCILCDVNLPDIDGFWVARRVRTEPGAVGTTPFLFLTEADDTEARLQGLNVGADLYVSKPFRNEEVVAQVGALIDMANRLRNQRDRISNGPPSDQGSALQGDLAQVSISTVLTVLELERRTGRLKVKGESRRGFIELADGKFVHATVEGTKGKPSALLRELLRWKTGSFAFTPDAAKAGSATGRQSLTGLLLEASRLEDESGR
jgi:DNA-binding response OmpR family regulator